MDAPAYAPEFSVERSYGGGWSVVASPGVGPGDASTTVEQTFASEAEAQAWIAREGAHWAAAISTLPGEADTPHRSL